MQISASMLLASQQSALAAGRPFQPHAFAAGKPSAEAGAAPAPQHALMAQGAKAARPGGLIDIKV